MSRHIDEILRPVRRSLLFLSVSNVVVKAFHVCMGLAAVWCVYLLGYVILPYMAGGVLFSSILWGCDSFKKNRLYDAVIMAPIMGFAFYVHTTSCLWAMGAVTSITFGWPFVLMGNIVMLLNVLQALRSWIQSRG